MRRVTEAEFWERVDLNGPLPRRRPDLGPCWVWTGPQMGGQLGNRYGAFGNQYAHRYVYELLVGPIPEGFEVDHLCRRRLCVRPTHLRAVTLAENRPTKTHCKRGHRFEPANTYRHNGHKHCRTCNNERRRRGGANETKTHCPKGHPYSGPNLRIDTDGGRRCRACESEQNRKRPGRNR